MNELELRDKHDRERLDTILRQATRIEQLEAALRDLRAVTQSVTQQDVLIKLDDIDDIIDTVLDQSSPPTVAECRPLRLLTNEEINKLERGAS